MKTAHITPEERERILGLIRRQPPIKYSRIGEIVGRHAKTIAGLAAANEIRRLGR